MVVIIMPGTPKLTCLMFFAALMAYSSPGILAPESSPPPLAMKLNSTEETVSTDISTAAINNTHGPSPFTSLPPTSPRFPPHPPFIAKPPPSSHPLLSPSSSVKPPSSPPSLPGSPSPPLSPAPPSNVKLPSSTLSPPSLTTSWYPPDYPFYMGYDYFPFPVGNKTVYAWDKDNMSPKDYQQSYCSKRCQDGKVVYLHNLHCPTVVCFECACKRPACEIYGICCPDIAEPYHVIKAPDVGGEQHFGPPAFPAVLTELSVLSPADTGERSTASLIQTEELHETSTDSLNITEFLKELTETAPSSQPLFNSVSNTSVEDSKQIANRYSPKAICLYGGHFSLYFLGIRSCPPDFEHQDITGLCEQDLANDEVTIQFFTRVSDNDTHVTYFNEYCAICNGVTAIVSWQLRIFCQHYMHVYMATSMEELLRLVLEMYSACTVEQEYPQHIDLFDCDTNFNRDDMIDICNKTGLWPAYDADVANACEGDELTGHVYTVKELKEREIDGYYKNIFCATCNMETYPPVDCGIGSGSNFGDIAPFSMLLGFRDKNTMSELRHTPVFTYSLCTDEEWSSPDRRCLQLHCPLGKVFVEGNCSTALDLIRGLGYSVRVWLTLETGMVSYENVELPQVNELLNNLKEQIRYMLEPLSTGFRVHIGIVTNVSVPQTANSSLEPSDLYSNASHSPDFNDWTGSSMKYKHSTLFMQFWVDAILLARESLNRDGLEYKLTENLLNNVIELKGPDKINMVFRPTAMIGDVDSDFETFCEVMKINNSDMTCHSSRFSTMNKIDNKDFILSSHLFLNITNVLNCRYVSFKPNQYVIENNNNSFPRLPILRINLNITTLNISDASDLNMLTLDRDSTLNVCHTLLDKNLRALEIGYQQQTSEANTSTLAQYILTLVCMGVSMFCLALTLVTYFCFKTLRSAAGINNIGLSSSLLVAQASLLASSHTNGPKALCIFLGILTHFLWLCMFTWSFICCYNMFRVFTAKTRRSNPTPHSQTIRIVKSIVLSFTLPAIVVITVVIASYLSSDGSKIGYGSRFCYLDSAMLVGLAVVGPLALITLSNLIFFIVAVVKIHNVRKLQQSDSFKKNDQNNLYVYIKLSSMTGAFWAIYILAEGLDVDALRFIAIILNGLQGVFIFFSYSCNKRVLSLYQRSMGIKSVESHSTSDRGTLTRLASEIHQQTPTDGNKDKKASDSVIYGKKDNGQITNAKIPEEDLNDVDLDDNGCETNSIQSQAPNGFHRVDSPPDEDTRHGTDFEDVLMHVDTAEGHPEDM